jgi:hypothetical protein
MAAVAGEWQFPAQSAHGENPLLVLGFSAWAFKLLKVTILEEIIYA